MTPEQQLVQRFRGQGDDIRFALEQLAGGWSAAAMKSAKVTDRPFAAVANIRTRCRLRRTAG